LQGPAHRSGGEVQLLGNIVYRDFLFGLHFAICCYFIPISSILPKLLLFAIILCNQLQFF
jgi:hypothetical protein